MSNLDLKLHILLEVAMLEVDANRALIAELTKALGVLCDACMQPDSYGTGPEINSDFIMCLVCQGQNGPGIYWKPGEVHADDCAVAAARTALAHAEQHHNEE